MGIKNSNIYLPDAILAGAPKCGTTSVFDYLKDHPQICASSEKETYYLMDKDYSLFQPDSSIHVSGPEGYKKYFGNCSGTGLLKLEATPDYLYQKTPIDLIPKWQKIPKVFFVLRCPEERIFSLYMFAKNTVMSIDKQMSFIDFVNAIKDKDSVLSKDNIISEAIEHGRYVNYLRAWRDAIGEDNIKVFLFDDLKKNPVQFMRNVSAFLSIDPEFYDSYKFEISNKSLQLRSQWLHKSKKIISGMMPAGTYKKILGKLYIMFNESKFKGKTRYERDILSKLHDKFIVSNSELEKEFDLDLDVWRKQE